MKKAKSKKSKAKIRKIVKRKTTIRAAPRTTKRKRHVERRPDAPATASPQQDAPSGPMNPPEPVAANPIDANR